MPEYLLKMTTAPAEFPVSVAEVKSDLRIQNTAEDTLFSDYIAQATEYVSGPNGVIGKALVSQTWQYSASKIESTGKLFIPLTPVQSISSITYFNAAGQSVSLTVNDYHFYSSEDWAYLTPKTGVAWPNLQNRLDAITVTFICGFGAADAVPANIKRAIRLLVAHWYYNKSAVAIDVSVAEMPLGVDSLLSQNRQGWVG